MERRWDVITPHRMVADWVDPAGVPVGHVIVFNDVSLCGIPKFYFHHYPRSCTHLALAQDARESRTISPFLETHGA